MRDYRDDIRRDHCSPLPQPRTAAQASQRVIDRGPVLRLALLWATAALLAALMVLAPLANRAQAQGLRIPHALVIVNQSYEGLPAVSDAIRQGRDLAFELRALGYRVSRLENANQAELIEGVGQFFADSQDASQRLVFYSGHSLSVDGHVYLLPSDAAMTSPFDLHTKALNLDAVVMALGAGPAPGALLVNAGFDHALADDARLVLGDGAFDVSAALADPSGRNDVVVLHAQSGGQANTANGSRLFINLFLASLVRDGRMDLMEALSTLASAVAQRSNGATRPQLSFDYQSTTTLAGQATAGSTPIGGFVSPAEQQAWDQAQSSQTLAGYDAYLVDYPGGVYAAQARQARADLYDSYRLSSINQTYITRRTSNTRQGPGTNFAKVDTLGADTQVTVIGKVRGQSWYLIELPNGQQAFIFASLVEPAAGSEFLAWQSVNGSGDLGALNDFLQRFPDGRFANLARQQRDALLAAEQARRLANLRLTPINRVYYLERDARVFDFPSRREGTALGRFSALQKLTVLGAVIGTNWFEVEIRGGRGFMLKSALSAYAGSDYEAWDEIKNSSNPRVFRRFLANFPASQFAALAQARLDELTPPEPEVIIINAPYYTLRGSRLRATPSRDGDILDTLAGNLVVDAISLTADRQWMRVRVRTSSIRREGYIFARLLAEYEGSALQAWRALGDNPSAGDLEAFLRNFPNSAFEAEARAKLAALSGPSESPLDGRMITSQQTRIFERPDRRSAALLTLNEGSSVRLLARVIGRDWVRVSVRGGGGVEGYVRLSHLREAGGSSGGSSSIEVLPIAPEIRVITRDGTRVFDAPEGAVLNVGRLQAQDAIQVNGKTSDDQWFRFSLNGRAAFVRASRTDTYRGSERKDWDDVVQRNSRQGYEFYLRKWPEGRWAEEARAGVLRLQGTPLEQLVDDLFDELKKQ